MEKFLRGPEAVRVEFASMDPAILEELLTDAWASKAPKTLVRLRDRSGGQLPGVGLQDSGVAAVAAMAGHGDVGAADHEVGVHDRLVDA